MLMALAVALALLAGCVSFDPLSPDLNVVHDKSDNSTYLFQAPTSASSSVDDAWQSLGFEWHNQRPQVVVITVGVHGIVPLTNVDFTVDGSQLATPEPSGPHFQGNFGWTQRRFVMPMQDFLMIASARTVVMRVGTTDGHGNSEFGSDHPRAIVNTKFKPFVDGIRQNPSSL